MYRICFPVLVLGLFVGCDNNGVQAGQDMRLAVDLRTGPGNVAFVAPCDDTRKCPDDPQTKAPARCATVVDFDVVGACAPTCKSNLDCDTDKPGLPFCTSMSGNGMTECVLFCDKDKRLGRECPVGWTCASVQTYRICRPPQDKPTVDMR